MEIIWKITADDIQKVQAFFQNAKSYRDVAEREQKNIKKVGIFIDKKTVWATIVECLLSTATHWFAVTEFLKEKPFFLEYDDCATCQDLEHSAVECLSSYGRIRFSKRKGKQIASNYQWLSNGGWEKLLSEVAELSRVEHPTAEVERKVANRVEDYLNGFGPKQSRNLL